MSRHTVTGRDEANNLGPISPSNTSSNRNTIGSRMSPALPQGWRRSSTEEMTKNNVLMTMLPSSNVMSSMRGFLRSTSAAFRSLERARSRRCAAFMPKRAVSEPLKKALTARSIGSDSARPHQEPSMFHGWQRRSPSKVRRGCPSQAGRRCRRCSFAFRYQRRGFSFGSSP